MMSIFRVNPALTILYTSTPIVLTRFYCLLLLCLTPSTWLWANYDEHEEVVKLIDELVEEDQFDRQELVALFAEAERKQSIIDAISRPAERTLTWGEYRDIFLKSDRIASGARFMSEHGAELAEAEAHFGVPSEIITAIIGVETFFGRYTGGYRVIDALSTLAFDYPKRAKFFRGELKHFLLLAREHEQNPLDLDGSYAGAMGLGQFIPSSYRAYAKDYDGDGFADIWNNRADAIWSVANYLAEHGWSRNEDIASKASASDGYDESLVNRKLKPDTSLAQLADGGIALSDEQDEERDQARLVSAMRLEGKKGTEFWIGHQNFYVITRYNHSKLYAMAVFQLAQEIRAAAQASEEQG